MARLYFKQSIEPTHLDNLILECKRSFWAGTQVVQACVGVPPGCGGVQVYSGGAPEGLI